MISLNERCTFQSQELLCFVYCGYRGNRYISAVLKVKPAGRERIFIFNKPICYFCYIFLNVNRWIDKNLMHYKNLKN